MELDADMRRHGVKHNAYTITSCISALANAGQWERAVQVRAQAVRKSSHPEAVLLCVSANARADFYCTSRSATARW